MVCYIFMLNKRLCTKLSLNSGGGGAILSPEAARRSLNASSVSAFSSARQYDYNACFFFFSNQINLIFQECSPTQSITSFGTLSNHNLSLQNSNIWVCEVLIYSGEHEIESIMSLPLSLSVPQIFSSRLSVDPNQGRFSCLFVWLTQSHRRLCSLSPLLKTWKDEHQVQVEMSIWALMRVYVFAQHMIKWIKPAACGYEYIL